MDNCSDYETTLMYAKAYAYFLEGFLYVYHKAIASQRVKHLMNHGRTERIRKERTGGQSRMNDILQIAEMIRRQEGTDARCQLAQYLNNMIGKIRTFSPEDKRCLSELVSDEAKRLTSLIPTAARCLVPRSLLNDRLSESGR